MRRAIGLRAQQPRQVVALEEQVSVVELALTQPDDTNASTTGSASHKESTMRPGVPTAARDEHH
jgi:hypothetical protein